MTTTEKGLKEHHQAILADLQAGELSYTEIAEKYGYSRSGIVKFAYRNGIVRSKTEIPRRGPKKHSTMPISALHKAIGGKLLMQRIKLGLHAQGYGELMGRTKFKVRNMELGLHDFTLSELREIAEEVELPLEDLIKLA